MLPYADIQPGTPSESRRRYHQQVTMSLLRAEAEQYHRLQRREARHQCGRQLTSHLRRLIRRSGASTSPTISSVPCQSCPSH